ncbi:MAG: thioredoxin domain-containing protein [Acidobacteria bacterium]|nr:thioredoxin domain-containing protein [Acidobacteriota bacterium]
MSHGSSTEPPTKNNRLAASKSPYLLQHAENPVDWYPWGPEAFARAKQEDKPIFLSIGYATCHWCHVMEHESFEHPLVAALMNETFINIKVDREERPDIDQVYMTVCQMLTGGGGWPLTIIMTPDKEPFYAATYIPCESVHGRIGMLDLVPRVAELWRTDRDSIHGTSERIASALERTEGRATNGTLDRSTVDTAFSQFADRFDATNGGFGSAPKFPSPHNLVFLTRYWRRTGNQHALAMVAKTLERMRLGGVYDQIGFGFHRYSTDPEWRVPHFEKMLYDQAMLIFAFTEAWLATSNPVFERSVREIATYVLRDMTSPEGGFYSAEDADSEGEEGLFYLWTRGEVEKILGTEDAAFAASIWNLEAAGNFRDEATGRRTGRNIPHLSHSHAETADDMKLPGSDFEARLETVRARLFESREGRVHPLKDDKVLTDWNGLTAGALAFAGRVLKEPEWVAAAERSVGFVFETMRTEDGRLLHRYRDGDASIPAFLDDHVFMTTAMLELYDATLDPKYLERALDLQLQTDKRFWDRENGGFFFIADDNEELLVRQKEIYDGAIPSGNSMAADNLVRLAGLTGRVEHLQAANRIFSTFAAEAKLMPSAHAQLMSALQRSIGPSLEVVVAGEPEAEDTAELIATVRAMYLPQAAVLLVPSGKAGNAIRKLAPFAESYQPVEGAAAAYVCRDFSCQLPTTDPDKLRALLEDAANQTLER